MFSTPWRSCYLPINFRHKLCNLKSQSMSLGKKESPYLTSRDIFSDKHIEIDIMMAISAKTIINKNAKALKYIQSIN